MFEIFLTEEAGKQLMSLKTDKGLMKRYKAVTKTLQFLASNPQHPGLHTHEFTSLKGPPGEKVFEAYAEQSTPAEIVEFFDRWRSYSFKNNNIFFPDNYELSARLQV